MTRDADLARLCAESYLPDPQIAIGDDLAAHITRTDDETIVAFRGTANPRGWFRNIKAIAKSHPMIGYCHAGFLEGACDLMQQLDLRDAKRVVLTGHSLGGALAIVLGALRRAVGEPVDELVTFGAPRAGYAKLASMWEGVGVRQYHSGNDPVPGVPFTLLAFPYRHVTERLIQVGAPDPAEPWNCHSIRRYEAVVSDLPEEIANA